MDALNVNQKTKKNQVPVGIFLFIVIVSIGIFYLFRSPIHSFFWFTGIALGFALQKSRFCFVAAIRDPYLIRSTALTKAMLIAFAISTIGIASIKYGAFINGYEIPGQHFIAPISIATVIGGLVFGIGMVLAGGCASGTLMRTGEGFLMQGVALFFFIIGSLWGEHDLSWWRNHFIDQSQGVFLPDVFGWPGALILQLLLLGFLYVMADRWEKINSL